MNNNNGWWGKLEDDFLITPKLVYFSVSVAYYSLYLYRAKFITEYLFLDDATYGYISGVMAIISFCSATLWSWFSDNLGRHRLLLVIICMGMSVAGELLLPVAQLQNDTLKTWMAFLVFSLYAVFVGGMMPLTDYLVLRMLADRPDATSDMYSRQCLFGTIAYGVTSYASGWLIRRFKEGALFFIMPASSLLAIVTLYACAPSDQPKPWGRIPTNEKAAVQSSSEEDLKPPPRPIATLLLKANFTFMLVVVFLIGSARAVMTTFLAKYWSYSMDLDDEQVGTAANYGIALELTIFAIGPYCIRLFGVYWMLLLAQAAMVLRAWCYVIMPPNASVYNVYGVELLKGVAFGFTQISGTKVARECAPEELKATAQALYSAFYNQLPLILTAFSGGWCYQQYGPEPLFLITAIAATVAVSLCTLKYAIDGSLFRRAQ